MRPPIPELEPVANASATHMPGQRNFGQIEIEGGTSEIHCLNRSTTLKEDTDNRLLEEAGSRIRSQMRLSDMRHRLTSLRVETC